MRSDDRLDPPKIAPSVARAARFDDRVEIEDRLLAGRRNMDMRRIVLPRMKMESVRSDPQQGGHADLAARSAGHDHGAGGGWLRGGLEMPLSRTALLGLALRGRRADAGSNGVILA